LNKDFLSKDFGLSKGFGIGFGVMAAVIVVVLWYGFAATKGNHLAPVGKIGKVRVQKVDDNISFVVIDFNMKNDSDRDMIVHSVTVTVDGPEGSMDGSAVSARDLEGAFKSYPELGQQYEPVLKERDRIPAHQELDRMVGARFDVPVEQLEARKKLTLKVDDVTGVEFVLTR
jgi:hypothetical protein